MNGFDYDQHLRDLKAAVDDVADDDWHDDVQHPVWHEGCADCVNRAAWIEANR